MIEGELSWMRVLDGLDKEAKSAAILLLLE
jgi:hypothetical protein